MLSEEEARAALVAALEKVAAPQPTMKDMISAIVTIAVRERLMIDAGLQAGGTVTDERARLLFCLESVERLLTKMEPKMRQIIPILRQGSDGKSHSRYGQKVSS